MPLEAGSRKRKLGNASVTASNSEEQIGSVGELKPQERVSYAFKNPNFVHSMKAGATSKRRIWKNLKQIIAAEKALKWDSESVTYSSVEAPPSFYPAKKYSDISGLPAKYMDPHTKLRYTTAEEFAQIRTLPSDIVSGLLQLRRASNLVG